MYIRDKFLYGFQYLLPILLICGWATSCVPALLGPIESNSSLVIGRVVINNKSYGGELRALLIGTIERGIEVEVESRDGRRVFNMTSEEQGYFFIPNILPDNYYVRRVSFQGMIPSYRGDRYEKLLLEVRRLSFRPIPGKIGYIGTLIIDVSEEGGFKTREVWEEERVRTYFLQRYGGSPWGSREFVAIGRSPAPSKEVL